jgi:hypothetical protein
MADTCSPRVYSAPTYGTTIRVCDPDNPGEFLDQRGYLIVDTDGNLKVTGVEGNGGTVEISKPRLRSYHVISLTDPLVEYSLDDASPAIPDLTAVCQLVIDNGCNPQEVRVGLSPGNALNSTPPFKTLPGFTEYLLSQQGQQLYFAADEPVELLIEVVII